MALPPCGLAPLRPSAKQPALMQHGAAAAGPDVGGRAGSPPAGTCGQPGSAEGSHASAASSTAQLLTAAAKSEVAAAPFGAQAPAASMHAPAGGMQAQAAHAAPHISFSGNALSFARSSGFGAFAAMNPFQRFASGNARSPSPFATPAPVAGHSATLVPAASMTSTRLLAVPCAAASQAPAAATAASEAPQGTLHSDDSSLPSNESAAAQQPCERGQPCKRPAPLKPQDAAGEDAARDSAALLQPQLSRSGLPAAWQEPLSGTRAAAGHAAGGGNEGAVHEVANAEERQQQPQPGSSNLSPAHAAAEQQEAAAAHWSMSSCSRRLRSCSSQWRLLPTRCRWLIQCWTALMRIVALARA